MKRYIYSTSNEDFTFRLDEVESMILVADASEFNPKNFVESISITSAKKLRKNYQSMTRADLLSLPEKELASIKDVTVLRKLKFEDLNPAQKVLVGQANRGYSDKLTKNKVKSVLDELKKCNTFFIWPTNKNRSFMKEIEDLGGVVDSSDVRKIVHSLNVEDFTDSTLSYLDTNWNSVLMIFEYNDDYTFKSIDENEEGITVEGLQIYIKLDVNNKDKNGIGAVSFHKPEFKMSHPYKK